MARQQRSALSVLIAGVGACLLLSAGRAFVNSRGGAPSPRTRTIARVSAGYLDRQGPKDADVPFSASQVGGVAQEVEFKKRPFGILRYQPGQGNLGAMAMESVQQSRYPGDPQGQAFVGGVQQGWVVKTVNGQDVSNMDFFKIMDLLDDEVADPRFSKSTALALEQQGGRLVEPAPLPVKVGFAPVGGGGAAAPVAAAPVAAPVSAPPPVAMPAPAPAAMPMPAKAEGDYSVTDADIEAFYSQLRTGSGGFPPKGNVVSEMVVKFFHGEFTQQGFKRYSGLWKGPPPGTIGKNDIKVGVESLIAQMRNPMFVTKGGIGYGVDETQKVEDDGKGWVWLAAEMSPGGLAVELFKSVPYGKRAILVAKQSNVDELFSSVNWEQATLNIDKTLGGPQIKQR